MRESVIRLMTRLAVQHGAVNLSQGFTDEAPHFELVWGGVAAALGGDDPRIQHLDALTLEEARTELGLTPAEFGRLPLRELLARLRNPRDRFNQYSFPFGLPELRQAIAEYTWRFYGVRPDPETQITVVLGATEGLSSVLRAVCSPGEALVIFQPFHEMYPSQSELFGLEPRYVTLREDRATGTWHMDRDEVRAACGPGARGLVLNTPHNPTGKVFGRDDLEFIASLCRERELFAFTDEIYEHIVYDGHRHHYLAGFEGMAERTFVINSISKTGSATGWRVGWVISPEQYTPRIRAVHDTLVIQAPTPLQKGAARLLLQDEAVFRELSRPYERKRQTLVDALRKVGFAVSPPEGSYYLFADYRQVPRIGAMPPMEAAMHLIEQVGVASVPGDNFYRVGTEGNDYLRFAFCRSLESLEEAGRRLAQRLG